MTKRTAPAVYYLVAPTTPWSNKALQAFCSQLDRTWHPAVVTVTTN